MTTLREAAQQALEALDEADTYHRNQPDQRSRRLAAMAALRAALIREEEASVWLAERKEHWRKEREKAQTTKDQDPELSAALGWPGGISDPVLDRTQLLQMMAALRLAAQQALEACEQRLPLKGQAAIMDELNVLRAALAQEQAEPVQEPVAWYFEARHIDSAWGAAVSLKHPGPEGVYTRNVKPLYTAPPQRTMVPLTEEEIYHATGHCGVSKYTAINIARVVEEASWEKNHG